jgi:hypothetical protein
VSVDDVVGPGECKQFARTLVVARREGAHVYSREDTREEGLPPTVPPHLGNDCGAGPQRDSALLKQAQHCTDMAIALFDRNERSCVEEGPHLRLSRDLPLSLSAWAAAVSS